MKHFTWKVAYDILSSRSNLFKKGIIESKLYPICERDEGTTVHALWSYLSATNVWTKAGNSVEKLPNAEVEFIDSWKNLRN